MEYDFRDYETRRVSWVELMLNTKFGAYGTNRFKIIHFFVNVSFSSAAFSDFESWRFLYIRCLGGLKSKLPAKFGDYRTNGS